MRVGLVQMQGTTDVHENLTRATRGVQRAADAGADVVLLPELADFIGTDRARLEAARPLHEHPFLDAMSELAATNRIHLLAGSVAVRDLGEERLWNTSVLFAPDGGRIGEYRKIHLFDATVAGDAYRESRHVHPGNDVVVADIGGVPVGMSICFDLRFPELYRRLVDLGARILVVPSAFTARTGAAHWEVLLRARAIENQCFVLAPDQVGVLPPGGPAWGHSMVIDPWGTVLANAGDEPDAVITVDLDLAQVDDVRASLPALAARRLT